MTRADDNLVSAFASVRRESNVKSALVDGERSNRVSVRFPVKTMFLVLSGLSTLKLR